MKRVEQVDVSIIERRDNRRQINEQAVANLMESMRQIGLLTPITVRLVDAFKCTDGTVADGVPVLVTGAHRLEAAKRLGWKLIDCFYLNDSDDLDAELCEIDENLMRAELTPVQQAECLKRRKEIWEAKQAQSGNAVSSLDAGGRGNKGFAQETAEKTGVTKQAINKAIARAEKIPEPIREKIEGTKLDTGAYLDSIKNLPQEEMAKRVESDLRQPKQPVINSREDLLRAERSRLFQTWLSVSEETRKWFLAEVAQKVA